MREPSRGFGYWLNIFANLAVVAGIVFLGWELRQNSQVMRAQTRHELSNSVVDLLNFSVADSSLADLIRMGRAGEPLSERGQFRFDRHMNAWLRYWEDVHYQYRNGLYDEVEFGKQLEAIEDALNLPGVAEYWCSARSSYSPQFVDELNELLTRPC